MVRRLLIHSVLVASIPDTTTNVPGATNIIARWTKDKDCNLTWGTNPHGDGSDVYQKIENAKGRATVGDAKETGVSAWELFE